ncbi:MAG: DNA-directed RNA polymerase subunit P [Candidatus Aenigmarchaeota archaeon]|nr:DNA-directed RNA polymerase subunit P [Candidatus Aenigmarchaeota archaeon]
MEHKCLKCKKSFNLEDRIRCPFCGFRVLVKARVPIVKKVKAR